MKDDPATADLPGLSLSTDMKAQLDEESDSVLPWPWSTGARAAIEQAVHAPGGDEAPRR